MLGVLALIFFVMSWWMRCYTNHDESVQVEKYIGMRADDAVGKIRSKGFRYVFSDSIFLVDKEPGIVLDQNPHPLARVKERRTIYLTISKSTPDEVNLPGLIGNYDYEQYVKKLKLLGIKARVRERSFDNKLEENTILHFYLGDKKITDDNLREGVKVPMGSVLDFVVSTRTGGSLTVPDLICMKYSEAEFIITSSNLTIGTVNEDDSVFDRDNAYVWKQEPAFAPGITMRIGEQMTVYLTQKVPEGCGQ